MTTTAVAPDWDAALCAQIDPNLFFPEGMGGQIAVAVKQAKQICAWCPILPDCRQWALDTRQQIGVWGGLDEHERRVVAAEGVRAA